MELGPRGRGGWRATFNDEQNSFYLLAEQDKDDEDSDGNWEDEEDDEVVEVMPTTLNGDGEAARQSQNAAARGREQEDVFYDATDDVQVVDAHGNPVNQQGGSANLETGADASGSIPVRN